MARRYLIALGSNVRHPRFGAPERVLAAALAGLADAGMAVVRAAPVMRSAPLGPSRRRYANTAALIETRLDPPGLLGALKQIEQAFGRRAGGRRWGARVLDLDIVLWQGGAWASPGLVVPHLAFRTRGFVLDPAALLAPLWRDPVTGLTLRQLRARHHRLRPVRPPAKLDAPRRRP